MALLHRAQLTPSKLDVVAGWLPSQPFFPSDAADAELSRVASFRFDDPAGEVGIETLIVDAGGTALQIPLTYRAAPLEGADASLLGTMEHSVLGTRWVYDAVGDPVYLAELVRVVLTGGTEVEQHYEENGVTVPKAGDAQVRGSGHPHAALPTIPVEPDRIAVTSDATATTVTADDVAITLVRVLGSSQEEIPSSEVSGGEVLEGETLSGTWVGMTASRLALVRVNHANA